MDLLYTVNRKITLKSSFNQERYFTNIFYHNLNYIYNEYFIVIEMYVGTV